MAVNPYGGTIIDLIRQGGADQAAALQRNGQIRGQMASDLGQMAQGTIGAILKERQQAPILAQEAKLRDLQVKTGEGQLAAQARTAADQTAMDTALGQAGNPDDIEAQLPGHLKLSFREAWTKSEAAKQQLQTARQTFQTALQESLGADAHGLTVIGADKNPEAVAELLTDAKGHGYAGADALLQQLRQAPDSAPQIVQRLVQGSSAQRKMLVEEADRTLRQTQEQRALQTAAQAQADRDADNKRQDAAAAETARHNRVVESRPPAGTLPNVEGNFDVTGDDFMKTIPAPWRQTVKKIANYEEDPTKVASMRGGNREKLMMWVNQVNPAYDQSSFAIRNPTRKAFTTGTQGQQVTAINTAVEHLDLLQQAADALKNGSFVPGNALYNTVRRTFGSAAPSNFATIKEMVDHEVGAVASKGVPTVADVSSQGKLGSASSSPDAIKGYIDTLIPLMGSKLNALHYQYQQAMGANDPWKPLTPQTEAILQRRGVGMGPQSEQAVTQTAKEGATQPIPGIPNSEATFKGGKWVRTK